MHHRTHLRTAALSFGITCGLLLLGVLVFAAVSSGIASPLSVLHLLGWKVLIWGALLAALAVWRPRLGLYIAAAAVAAIVDILLTNLGAFGTGGVLLFLPGWVLTIAAFTAVAAIGCLLAQPRTSGRHLVFPIAIAVLLTVGGAVALSLPYQWFRVYFTIWGPAPIATDAEADKYLASAIAAVALTLAAVVLAAVQRRRGLTVLAAVLLGLALLLGFVFQVPQGRWVPSPTEPAPYNSNYVPCFGEGDPNCVGG